MNKHQAIFKLYSNVVTIRGDIAYDKDEKEVNYDNAAVEALVASEAYKEKRAAEYPSFIEYLDGVVKGDQAQIQAYIDACQAVKNKYPKGK
jgi:predicted deacetylase